MIPVINLLESKARLGFCFKNSVVNIVGGPGPGRAMLTLIGTGWMFRNPGAELKET